MPYRVDGYRASSDDVERRGRATKVAARTTGSPPSRAPGRVESIHPHIMVAMGYIQRAHAELYLHLVWGTWDRAQLITREMESSLYANLARQCRVNGADVIAMGGITDHVHVFVRFPTTISVAEFARRLKGASSHFVTHVLRHPGPFKWQGGYGAFTVSRRGVEVVREYVRNQETRHNTGNLIRVLERTGT